MKYANFDLIFLKDSFLGDSAFKRIFLSVLILSAICMLIPAGLCASPDNQNGPSYEWMKSFSGDEKINSVWELSDGSYVAGGHGVKGRELIFISNTGDIVSKTSIPGGDENASIKFVEESPAGGLYLFTDGENLIKTDLLGNIEWTYHQPVGVISSIEVSDNGNVLMTGDFYQSFLTMISVKGEELWNKTLGTPKGGGQYRLTSVQKTPDGNFIIGGYINPIIYTENYRSFMMKTDENGEIIWSAQYSFDDSGMIISIIPLENNNYAAALVEEKEDRIALSEDNSICQASVFIIGNDGEELSKIRVPTADVIYHIKAAVDGGYYLLADRYDKITDKTEYLIIRLDNKGSKLWTKNYGDVRISSLQITSDNGLLISGTDQITNECMIIKTSPDTAGEQKSCGFGVITAIFAGFCFVLYSAGKTQQKKIKITQTKN